MTNGSRAHRNPQRPPLGDGVQSVSIPPPPIASRIDQLPPMRPDHRLGVVGILGDDVFTVPSNVAAQQPCDGLPLDVGRDIEPAQLEDRRDDVDEFDQCVRRASRRDYAGQPHDERRPDRLLVTTVLLVPPVLPEQIAMVAIEDK